ncbi:Hypothetical protein PBC10988_29140 [Planctomycetales bacterium 10988]|nr:Hypothetical protein PBC10988_29140 [Planctomycetales bacterium 10988]
MANAFNPYQEWLGISLADQPPNHYQLLGLGRIQTTPESVRSAQAAREAELKFHQEGDHSEAAQRLLEEIRVAALILGNEEKRHRYDEMLRLEQAADVKKSAPLHTPEVKYSQPVAVKQDKASPEAATSKPAPARTKPKPKKGTSSQLPFLLGIFVICGVGGLVFASLAGGLIFWLLSSNLVDSSALSWGESFTSSEVVRVSETPLSEETIDSSTDENSTETTDTKELTPSLQEVPQLQAISEQSIPELEPYSLDLDAYKKQATKKPVRWLLTKGPEGMELDEESGLLLWTPTEAQGPEKYQVTVKCELQDSPQWFGEQHFSIEVNEVIQPPEVGKVGEQVVIAGRGLNVQIPAKDTNLPPIPLKYSIPLENLPGLSIDETTGELQWQSSQAVASGLYRVSVKIDSEAPEGKSKLVEVPIRVVYPPRIGEIPEQFVANGNKVELLVPAIDPNNPPAPLEYSLDPNSPQGAELDPQNGYFSWNTKNDQAPGAYRFRVWVTAQGIQELSTSRSFLVWVETGGVSR